jgi:hypothetical protein
LTDQQRAHAEARARILADLRLTRADAALFTTLHYGLTTTPEFLPGSAAAEDYNPIGPRATEEECRVALGHCLARGWLQIIDEPTRERIAGDLRAGGYLGPIYQGGGPEVGCVDFADAGLALWRRLGELTLPGRNPPFAYTDGVHEKTARFFQTAAAATAASSPSPARPRPGRGGRSGGGASPKATVSMSRRGGSGRGAAPVGTRSVPSTASPGRPTRTD